MIFHFAMCDFDGCDWVGPIEEIERDADNDLINHEQAKHFNAVWDRATADQAQTDIGDDMYERSRYDEQDIDVEPGREDRYEPPMPR